MALYDNDVLVAIRRLRGPANVRVFMVPDIAKQLRDDGNGCTDDEIEERLDAMVSEGKIARHAFSISWNIPGRETPQFHLDADAPTYAVFCYRWWPRRRVE